MVLTHDNLSGREFGEKDEEIERTRKREMEVNERKTYDRGRNKYFKRKIVEGRVMREI